MGARWTTEAAPGVEFQERAAVPECSWCWCLCAIGQPRYPSSWPPLAQAQALYCTSTSTKTGICTSISTGTRPNKGTGIGICTGKSTSTRTSRCTSRSSKSTISRGTSRPFCPSPPAMSALESFSEKSLERPISYGSIFLGPRTRKMVKMWHFNFFWSSAVNKPLDFFYCSQLF